MSKTAPGQEEEQSVDQQMYQSMSIYVDFVRREVAATFPDTRVKTRLSVDPTSVLNWLSTCQCLFAPMAQSQGALGEEEEEEEEDEE